MLLFASLVLVLLGGLQVAQGNVCKPTEKIPPGAIFPDIFKMTQGSYMFSVEANLPNNKTEYITEFVDTNSKKSVVEVKREGRIFTYLSFEEENEVFIIGETGCETVNISTAYTRDDVHWITKSPQSGDDYVGMGPSSLIRAAYKDFRLHPEKFTINKDYAKERGLNCMQWTWCYDAETSGTFYFTDGRTEKPYGLDGIFVPLRITVKDKKDSVWEYNFFRMIPKVWPQRLENVLQIPPKKGCQRLSSVKTAPSFGTKNIYLEAEIKYTPFKNNVEGFTYISNVKYARHRKSSITAVHWTPWTNKDPNSAIQPGDNMIKIMTQEFVYFMDKTKDVCDVMRSDDSNARMTFPLPDGQNIDDLLKEVFDFGDTANYNYIGKATERGIPAAVYERIVVTQNPSQKKIITRYYIDEGVLLDDEFKEANAPLKIVLYVANPTTESFDGQVVINIYDFKSRVTHLHELFDVSPCFKKLEESKWFQIKFPLGKFKAEDVMPGLYLIRSGLVDDLQTYDKDKSPLRIPKMQVDVDQDYIYATGLMLERPPFLLDFKNNVQTGKQFSKSHIMGVMTLSDCAKACLERSSCESFSYCGAICSVLEGKLSDAGELVTSSDCSIYTNDKYGKSMWTMNQLSLSFASQVETRSLMISLPQKDNPEDFIDLVADDFKNNLAFGLDGFNQIGQDFNSMLGVFKLESRLKKGVATMENELSFESCKAACISNGFCESVSYCLGTSECTLSDQHGENILADAIEVNDHCMILSRNYVARFREYPELMVVVKAQKETDSKTPEDCAKNCVKEGSFECQSFDFCDGEKLTCLLHTHHFNSLEENQALNTSQTCRHFSRNYLHEFDPTLGKDMGTNLVGLWVENVPTEECARLCNQNADTMPCAGFTHCTSLGMAHSYTCGLRKTANQALYQPNKGCNSYVWKAGAKKTP